MACEIIDCEQGSAEWYQARLGLPTASEFATIMAKGRDGGESKTRKTYLLKLAGEIITGEPMESYSNGYMERGKELEEEARNLYALMHDVDPVCVGFCKNKIAGCSPDSLIADDGGCEIKVAVPHIQAERLLRGDLPPEHKAQVQGGLWITERKWWDFISYCPKMPLLVVRVERDEGYIANLAGAVKSFNLELQQTVTRIRYHGKSREERFADLGAVLAAG
jgi:hypothetical protein